MNKPLSPAPPGRNLAGSSCPTKGTIFLDEIAEMSPRLQVKLLHMLQDHQYSPWWTPPRGGERPCARGHGCGGAGGHEVRTPARRPLLPVERVGGARGHRKLTIQKTLDITKATKRLWRLMRDFSKRIPELRVVRTSTSIGFRRYSG